MHGVAALSDGSVVLVGSTEGDYASENAGGLDFVVVKLTATGVVDWQWQVTKNGMTIGPLTTTINASWIYRVRITTLGLCLSADPYCIPFH